MVDKFLQFADKATAMSVLDTHNMSPIIADEHDNNYLQRVHSSSDERGNWLVEVGILVVQTPAIYDVGGNEITPAILVPGYHVNVRLDGFTVDFGTAETAPATPQSVFA